MKKYWKQLVILLAQLLMFYAFPLEAGPTDAMGMVVLILFATLVLALVMGLVTKTAWKFLYPLLVAVLFIPSVWLYYNKSALVHAVWYLVDALIGLSIGSLIRLLFKKEVA